MLQYLAEGDHEKSLVSAVVRSEEIGVRLDHVGALASVKKVLYETVILPLRKQELSFPWKFEKGLRTTFRPPGTGKTLMAKALATEAGANFINVTAATLASKDEINASKRRGSLHFNCAV
ncbi:P-loop containing nucleoside triphosphate hydrolases superfamily protein [Perilla frutescens var. hirtella]|nr:P-loop containing nucleoside triphosphate hydrolases superfamily protein [Perilla frutescens var. frutescens]KAH6801334.1 P-loop containing nucleoside triphosphate hydrolases superfamily protein [Perilla frutescens var. hirtella]